MEFITAVKTYMQDAIDNIKEGEGNTETDEGDKQTDKGDKHTDENAISYQNKAFETDVKTDPETKNTTATQSETSKPTDTPCPSGPSGASNRHSENNEEGDKDKKMVDEKADPQEKEHILHKQNDTNNDNAKDENTYTFENNKEEVVDLTPEDEVKAKKVISALFASKEGSLNNNDATDNADRTSVFSLYMDKDFRYYFQHPYSRLGVAYFVVFCNFLIYAEDPVAHSQKECYIPVVGCCFSFVCTKYPPNGWAALKVIMWLIAILVGIIVGKIVVHGIFFNKICKLKMFLDEQGSWMTMFFTTILSLFIFSHIYNGFLMIGGDSTIPYRISSLMGVKNSFFMKAAACGTWCGDLFTAWMVTDIMLQEKLYPHWARPVRDWWKVGYRRIYLFWIVIISTSGVVLMVICTDWINWDRLNHGFLPSNEVSRSFLASFILVFDLLILMQDWDFPHFINNFDIKLPGLNTSSIKIVIPKMFRKEKWMIHITGKWFNYGIIFFVMILDLNMWKNQMFFTPFDYGQYDGPDHRIHTVLSEEQLEYFNKTELTYTFRINTTNPETNQTYYSDDNVMNSRFYGFHIGIKCIAFVPSMVAFICLGVFIWYFGRWKPKPEDPYAGRLKKRKRRRSMREYFNAWRERRANNAAKRAGGKAAGKWEKTAAASAASMEGNHPDIEETVETNIDNGKSEV